MIEKKIITYHPPREIGYFTIPGVRHNGEVSTYRLLEKMTVPLTNKQLIQLYNQERRLNNPHPADSVLTFSILQAAYELKNGKREHSEKLRDFLEICFRQDPNTLTVISYFPEGQDKVTHNYGTLYEESHNVKIAERNGWIKNLSNKNFLESILGTQDIKKINNVFRWIMGLEGFVWKPNDDPKEKEDRIFGFYIEEDKFGLDCDGSPSGAFPSFLVQKKD